jgi:hypothetical protein
VGLVGWKSRLNRGVTQTLQNVSILFPWAGYLVAESRRDRMWGGGLAMMSGESVAVTGTSKLGIMPSTLTVPGPEGP